MLKHDNYYYSFPWNLIDKINGRVETNYHIAFRMRVTSFFIFREIDAQINIRHELQRSRLVSSKTINGRVLGKIIIIKNEINFVWILRYIVVCALKTIIVE